MQDNSSIDNKNNYQKIEHYDNKENNESIRIMNDDEISEVSGGRPIFWFVDIGLYIASKLR